MTSCTPMDRLQQSLLVHAPGSTEAIIRLELFNVLDEFFRRTSAWRYVAQIDLEENVLEYSMALPADATFVRMMGVSHNGMPVPAAAVPGSTQTAVGRIAPELTFPDGDASFAPDLTDLAGGVFSYAIYRPEFISVTRPPTPEQVSYPMLATMALSIARGCLECECGDWQLEDWMYDMFFQDWYEGGLGRLYAMASKPWSSEKLAIYHGKRFRVAMAQRKQEANRGFVYARPGWRYPKTGGWV